MKMAPISQLPSEWRPLIEKARAVRALAYAPYSHFLVGSSIEDERGEVHGGCNVENASYSGAICAERTAIVKMISVGIRRWKRAVVVTSAREPIFPCGICLQVMREFGPDGEIVAIDADATVFLRATLRELLPHSFGPEHLPESRA